MKITEATGSRRLSLSTGAVTLVAAATATAGHLFAMRWATPGYALRLLGLDIEFLTTTAFSAAQEVGFDVTIARNFTANPTGGTTYSGVTSGKPPGGMMRFNAVNTFFAGAGFIHVGTTDAFTAGTQTLETAPICKSSFYSNAVGTNFYRTYDFTKLDFGGLILDVNEGFIIRNSILMGTAGVGRWWFTPTWDEIAVAVG